MEKQKAKCEKCGTELRYEMRNVEGFSIRQLVEYCPDLNCTEWDKGIPITFK